MATITIAATDTWWLRCSRFLVYRDAGINHDYWFEFDCRPTVGSDELGLQMRPSWSFRPSFLLRQAFAFLFVGSGAWAIASPVAAQESSTDCASDVADQQGVTAFLSLIDGQPTDPKTPTLNLAVSRQSGVVAVQPALQLAPGGRRGLCDAVIALQLPPLNIAAGQAILGRNVGISWEQRWQEDTGLLPTIATMLMVTVDYSGPSTITTVQGMVIAAKTTGPTVLYVNAGMSAVFGNGATPKVIPTLTLGAKWPARGGRAVVGDIVLTKGAPPVIELGYQFSGPYDIGLGPGISVSIERRPSIGIGLVVQREF